MLEILNKIPWWAFLAACLTLGLAPFTPPHVWEKLRMLFRGDLVRGVDWFDLALHGTPWLLLLTKVIVSFMKKN
jgi:hypothetical protein